jgi:hypothetical protein
MVDSTKRDARAFEAAVKTDVRESHSPSVVSNPQVAYVLAKVDHWVILLPHNGDGRQCGEAIMLDNRTIDRQVSFRGFYSCGADRR